MDKVSHIPISSPPPFDIYKIYFRHCDVIRPMLSYPTSAGP